MIVNKSETVRAGWEVPRVQEGWRPLVLSARAAGLNAALPWLGSNYGRCESFKILRLRRGCWREEGDEQA